METKNEAMARPVSQGSGVTIDEIVKREEGEYKDEALEATEKAAGLSQSPSTCNPFGGLK